ncbi:MAG: hypothetical protein HY518_00550 [Candidatus Aenigmarchaeota archaeon]|nr:hypothetical protein [Candidatus Aenigmarchaeota archaeon]
MAEVAKSGDKVTVKYKGKLASGKPFDEKPGGHPLAGKDLVFFISQLSILVGRPDFLRRSKRSWWDTSLVNPVSRAFSISLADLPHSEQAFWTMYLSPTL